MGYSWPGNVRELNKAARTLFREYGSGQITRAAALHALGMVGVTESREKHDELWGCKKVIRDALNDGSLEEALRLGKTQATIAGTLGMSVRTLQRLFPQVAGRSWREYRKEILGV